MPGRARTLGARGILLRKYGQRKEAPEFEDSDETRFLYSRDVIALPLPGPSCKARRGKPGVASAITGGDGDPVAWGVRCGVGVRVAQLLGGTSPHPSPGAPSFPRALSSCIPPGQGSILREHFGGRGGGGLFVI